MDHGFTREHFDLLARWANHHYDRADPVKAEASARLKQAHIATERWANALQQRLFPRGYVKIRKAPINQGQAFSPYTWAKIYPSRSSPKDLAFTVGIDQQDFVVKIDTVEPTAVRAPYEALRAGPNAHSPFGAVLPRDEGLKVSFEELVAWSADAIAKFRMSYEEVLQRIGLGVRVLTLITDESISRECFANWRQTLLEGAARKAGLFWLLEGGIVFRLGRSGRTSQDDRMELGVDPTSRLWAVQINEPRITGDHNSLSAIGESPGGERFLLRQGMLRPNEPGGPTIAGDEFVRRAGLAPVGVQAEGLAARRQWFVVCSLDSSGEEMRLATSRFVDRCAAARAAADAGEAPSPFGTEDLFASGEAGSSYRRRAREREEERIILQRHGTVWLALAQRLSEAGISIRKGRHQLGFEVDAEIEGAATAPLLVEIKTGVSAGDIHGGLGQLHLYPRLIPRLASFGRALLLPSLPAPEVQAAVEGCGVEIHTFELTEGDGEVAEVTFSADFLKRCGVPLG